MSYGKQLVCDRRSYVRCVLVRVGRSTDCVLCKGGMMCGLDVVDAVMMFVVGMCVGVFISFLVGGMK